MLAEHGIEYSYREYTEEPLTRDELNKVVQQLDVPLASLLRKNDKAYKENGLTGHEDRETILSLMEEHPTLLQRPIAVMHGRAVVSRPAERLLELLQPTD